MSIKQRCRVAIDGHRVGMSLMVKIGLSARGAILSIVLDHNANPEPPIEPVLWWRKSLRRSLGQVGVMMTSELALPLELASEDGWVVRAQLCFPVDDGTLERLAFLPDCTDWSRPFNLELFPYVDEVNVRRWFKVYDPDEVPRAAGA